MPAAREGRSIKLAADKLSFRLLCTNNVVASTLNAGRRVRGSEDDEADETRGGGSGPNVCMISFAVSVRMPVLIWRYIDVLRFKFASAKAGRCSFEPGEPGMADVAFGRSCDSLASEIDACCKTASTSATSAGIARDPDGLPFLLSVIDPLDLAIFKGAAAWCSRPSLSAFELQPPMARLLLLLTAFWREWSCEFDPPPSLFRLKESDAIDELLPIQNTLNVTGQTHAISTKFVPPIGPGRRRFVSFVSKYFMNKPENNLNVTKA